MRNFLNSIIILSVLCALASWMYEYQYSKLFVMKNIEKMSVKEQYRMLECLTENIYYEAAGEKIDGKIGIGQVTLSRIGNHKFGDDICLVVHKKAQFSWTMDKPKALVKINKDVYEDSRFIAKKVLFEGERIDCIADSMYYHAVSVKPKWDFSKLKKTCQIGNHIFYKDI